MTFLLSRWRLHFTDVLAHYTVPVVTQLNGPVGGLGMLVEIQRNAELPLHEQVERSIRESIQAGRLAAEARLPSSRALAKELGISRGVVAEAYSQLAAEGYLLMRQGAPVRVARTVRMSSARPPAR